jgi:L,D-transpeptidase catalytic domain/Bacterial SH3 domain
MQSNDGLTRRGFIRLAGSAAAFAGLMDAGIAHADPQAADATWIANHLETRLLGADGQPVVGLPKFTRMRVLRSQPDGQFQVWVPRFHLVGKVPATAIGPVAAPSPDELEAERQDGPPLYAGSVGMPGRIVGGANLRTWPVVGNNLLRQLGHNAPVRVIDSVEGDNGEEWYRVNGLDPKTYDPTSLGYIHNSVVRLPRLRYNPVAPDRADISSRHFEADLREPALLTAYEDGGPVWSTLTLKGTVSHRTPNGVHRVLWRVPNETMTSERVYPPIPRDAPGGYYLKGVLWTQYFTSDGASIHYNYWSSNWGYAGSHGCLGVGYNEAKFAWNWAGVGTPVYVFT